MLKNKKFFETATNSTEPHFSIFLRRRKIDHYNAMENPKPILFIYRFIIIISISSRRIGFAVAQQQSAECILDLSFSKSPYFNGCEGGDWDGFLLRNCCGVTFQGYLYGLGEHANQTGDVYLNSTDQGNCLTSMKTPDVDVFSCGIQKLASGGGGCSDFSVSDVENKLGNELRSLNENCRLETSPDDDGGWNKSCGSCVRSWKRHIKSVNVGGKEGTDICRFSVLVALTSTRIYDVSWVRRIYKCLGEQEHINADIHQSLEPKNKNRRGIWILVGGLIAIVVMAVIFTIIMILSFRRFKTKAPPKKEGPKNALQVTPGMNLNIPIMEVKTATNNLDEMNLIGEGTAGKVYKGKLSNNQQIAVKHIINDGYVETFVREVTSLSHIRHPNLVALLGYCEEEEECFLVYELCPNGNLSEWLFGKEKVLQWIQRLEIAIDCARGLWFLHTYPEGCIVHRDIKPTNILLGTNFEAKLSDFGLSKVIDQGDSYVSSEVRGTFGYVDPEYQSNHHVNSSGDVYSFGIVLLQILSGKRVINMNLKKPMPLDKMAKVLTKGGSITEFADPKLDGEYSAEAFDLTLKLALSCTARKRQRPSMEQVVEQLEKSLDISTRAEASTPQATTPERHSLTP